MKRTNRILSAVLAIVITMGMIPFAQIPVSASGGAQGKMIVQGTDHLEGKQATNVYYGSYEGDPIKWRTLQNKNGELYLLSDRVLTERQYDPNDVIRNLYWADCMLRRWLNNEFYLSSFSRVERGEISTQKLKNIDSPGGDADGGPDTVDNIFVLSYSDLGNTKLFNKSNPSSADSSRVAYDLNGKLSSYWCRTPYDSTWGFVRIIVDAEEHLCEDLDIDVISKIACLSAYDAQRMFGFITEMSLSEYIRKRRLTLAGEELKNGNAKVIDVALKYGYDSPVSFARAFQTFHGITPSMAKSSNEPLRSFSRLVFQISVKEVMNMIKSEKMIINGKEYDASYYGEVDMSSWSDIYSKRCYWRLEDAYEDFKDCFRKSQVLPYNNYPSMNIKPNQVFVIDYYCKNSEQIDRKYYISCGEVWNDLECTTEIAISLDPLRLDEITVNGKTYVAEYYGDQYIGNWSENYLQRTFWRLQNAYEDFKDKPFTGDALPYNNYNPMNIEIGQVFVIDYFCKDGETVQRRYYVSDGRVWDNMECTSEVTI